MKRPLRNIILSMVASLSVAASVPVGTLSASESVTPVVRVVLVDDHDDALKAIKRGEIMSYSQIKRSVQSRLGGRVVDIKLRLTNRGWQYFLRLTRKDGRVVAAVVDGATGRILSTR